jgi:hypothetical protein
MVDATESVKAPAGWAIGLRVTRPDDDRSGTIVGIDRQIKVKWDNGRTSYYNFYRLTNVRLEFSE